jgi:eukaryotic-like serine/threonine-protein kinase
VKDGDWSPPRAHAATAGGTSDSNAPAGSGGQFANLGAILESGSILANRYEILEMLGLGGMGAVYKARDRELDRLIALKIIRPDLAKNPDLLQRFKQELLTARQVTHKNVIRIFDISEADNVKFITMEYVAGQDLRSLLDQKGKLPPEEAMQIISQICRGLEAAHSEGVIHRDLKPSNIMRDATGRIVIMDFGLARQNQADAVTCITQTGMMIGTLDYMSPEQAQGKTVDARSDLFTVGLISYELLTGNMPFKAESAVASLLRRTQERAKPVSEVDASVPRSISQIVSRCLEQDLEKRYQTAQEMLDDLDGVEGRRPISVYGTRRATSGSSRRLMLIGGAVVLSLVLAGSYLGLRRLRHPTSAVTAHKPVSVLVADFTNHTGDPIFDGTLEPMFNVALEGASFINAFSRGEARKLASQLPQATDKLDEQAARLVAVSQGVGAVVTGSLSRRGAGYKLSMEAIDAVTGNSIADAEVSAATKDEVMLAIPKLAAPIRAALGDTTPESVQLSAAETFTAGSLEAAHEYGVAQERLFGGKMEEALGSFAKAVELDPNFGRAYSGMAATSRNLGRREDAEKYFKLAMAHIDRMTERERYRTRGAYYIMIGDLQKCVEEYSTLVAQYPADNIGHNNLAVCFSNLRNMPKAVEEARRAVELSPKGAMQRRNLSLYAAYAGDFQTAEREARAVQQINPSYEKGYLTLAYAQLGQGQPSQAAETYQQLEKVSVLGASIAASGLGDLALYEGRFSDAARIFENGAAADLKANTPERAAEKFAALAYTQLSWGHRKPALDAAERALANNKKANIRFLMARVLVEAGETTKARAVAAELGSELHPEPQAYAKLVEGEIALKEKEEHKAIQTFTEANKLLDSWISRFDLGRAYLEAGLFAEADSEFDRCMKRRGEALELNDGPTYGYFPSVYYYQGRVRQGLKSAGFTDSYRAYLSIRGKGGEDPLAAEVRHRLGQ